MKSIVILISGRGSNMEAILGANLPLNVKAVISNRPNAVGLATAAARAVPPIVIDHQKYPSREAFDSALAEVIEALAPDYIVLAGFMRVLTQGFVERYPRRMVNIHPSLLPAFPGLHTHRQALAAGVKIHGCTVHFVTPELDHGPIIAQAAVPVLPSDDEHTLAQRVLVQEHRLYPEALRWLAQSRIGFTETGVVRLQAADVLLPAEEKSLVNPRE